MADVLETIKSMIRQGASADEIVDTLRSMGIPEDEARKLIILAERDMLRVLRNEIREIAADAFDERAEKMKKELSTQVSKIVDVQMKLAQKTLTDMIRDELNKYISTVSRLEERVSLIERKVYDIEDRIARLETYKPRNNKAAVIHYLLPLIGMGLVGAAAFFPVERGLSVALFILGVLLIIGGVFLG